MPKLITVTDMVRSFSDIIGKVYYKGETFDIKKGANIVARLSPAKRKATIAISELNEFFKNSPHLDQEDAEDFMQNLKDTRALQTDFGLKKWD